MAAAAALLAGLLAVSRPRAPAVPLVNLTALALGDAAELAVLKHATRSLGVFRVVGHGVDGASVINASKALFALPLDAKLATSASAAGGAFQRGYIPLGSESGLADYFEVKEGFCYGHAWGKGEYPEGGWPNNLTGANSWPDEMHGLGGGWRATLEGFFDASARLAARLTAELPRALGHRALGQQPPQPPPPQRPPPQRPAQPGTAAPAGAEGAAEGSGAEGAAEGSGAEGAAEGSGAEGAAEGSGAEGAADWAALCEGGEPISIMRLFHYFAATHRPELAAATPRTGSSPHTDWHMLTVILQDQQGGLQVLDQGGSWIDVPAIQGELTILLGDYLHWLSAGETVISHPPRAPTA